MGTHAKGNVYFFYKGNNRVAHLQHLDSVTKATSTRVLDHRAFLSVLRPYVAEVISFKNAHFKGWTLMPDVPLRTPTSTRPFANSVVALYLDSNQWGCSGCGACGCDGVNVVGCRVCVADVCQPLWRCSSGY